MIYGSLIPPSLCHPLRCPFQNHCLASANYENRLEWKCARKLGCVAHIFIYESWSLRTKTYFGHHLTLSTYESRERVSAGKNSWSKCRTVYITNAKPCEWWVREGLTRASAQRKADKRVNTNQFSTQLFFFGALRSFFHSSLYPLWTINVHFVPVQPHWMKEATIARSWFYFHFSFMRSVRCFIFTVAS